MLVVISDLHFEEEALDRVCQGSSPVHLPFVRNLDPEAFHLIIARLAAEVERNQAHRLDVVLAGDVFDLHRTMLWFGTCAADGSDVADANPQRPYVAIQHVTPALEAKVLAILDAIAAEPRVAGALDAFRRLWQGRYFPEDGGGDVDAEFPLAPDKIQCVYLPGNHDRLANATPAIRRKVRQLLGMPPSDAPFPHTWVGADPRVLVRHGHEYDAFNFGGDYANSRGISTTIPDADYDAPTFGDFVTIDVVGALPWQMRQVYGHAQILSDSRLSAVYLRLLEFDDVRPQSRLLDFVLEIPGKAPNQNLGEDDVWRLLQPVLCALLDDIHDDPFLHQCLARMKPDDLKMRLALVAVREALATRPWRLGLPLALVRSLLDKLGGGGGGGNIGGNGTGGGPATFATREDAVTHGKVRFVAAGHTHSPDTVPIGHPTSRQVFIDTGTWRNRLLPTAAGRGFARLKALSYLAVYGSGEDNNGAPAGGVIQESFDFWSGFAEK